MNQTPLEEPAPRARWLRLVLLAMLLGALWLAVDRSGLRASLSEAGLRRLMADAGAPGIAAYFVAFALGQLAQLPGLMFVFAASIAYGPWLGFLLGYTGALIAVSISFGVVRGVGGRQLSGLRWAWVRRALAQLETRPVRTIALLRLVFILSPPLNYALAMSPTPFRHYVLGSALGLIAPIGLLVVASDRVLRLFAD